MDTGDKPYSDSKATISICRQTCMGQNGLKCHRHYSDVHYLLQSKYRCGTYIALDADISQKPDWMDAFSDTRTTLQTDAGGGHLFNVYTRHYATVVTVALGENDKQAQMYIVAALSSAPGMEPATDLKPTIAYKADAAVTTGGGLTKEEISGKKCVTFKAASAGTLEWAIATGVGGQP